MNKTTDREKAKKVANILYSLFLSCLNIAVEMTSKPRSDHYIPARRSAGKTAFLKKIHNEMNK